MNKRFLLFTIANVISLLWICLHAINKKWELFPEWMFCPRGFIVLFFLNCVFLIYLLYLLITEK